MDCDMDYSESGGDVEGCDIADSIDDGTDGGELDFSEIPCLDTDMEPEGLELEDMGEDLVIEEEYETSELDQMLSDIQNGQSDLNDLNGENEREELEQMLSEWEENSDDDDQNVYVKRYPR